MERNCFKENSILAMMPKESKQALQTCFDELHLRFDATDSGTEDDNIYHVLFT